VLLYFLVTGRYPFEGRTLMEIAVGHGTGRRRLLADERPDLPDRFIRIVERALASNPADRFASAGTLIHELSDMLPVMRRTGTGEDRLETPHVPPGPGAPETGPAPTDPAAATPAAAAARRDVPARPAWVRRAAVTAAAVVAVPWTLGLLTSIAFNNSLTRPASFAGDSIVGWWAWGARVLIPPIVYMTAGALAFLLVRSACRLVRQLVRPLDRWCARMAARGAEALRQAGLADLGNRAQLLIVAQTLAVALILWRFWPVFLAQYTILNHAELPATAPLHTAYEHEVTRMLYGLSVDALVLCAGVSWIALIRARRRSGLPRFDASAAAGTGLLALAFLALWAVPYRITWFNEFPRVQYGGDRCYAVGQRAETLLLHCPDVAPPRNRQVRSSEVERLDVVESIFTPPDGVERPAVRQRR